MFDIPDIGYFFKGMEEFKFITLLPEAIVVLLIHIYLWSCAVSLLSEYRCIDFPCLHCLARLKRESNCAIKGVTEQFFALRVLQRNA